MKKIKLGFILLVSILLTSCGFHEPMSKSIQYDIIDTTSIVDGVFRFTDYYIIIKMDGTLYSARMDQWGKLYKIDRKLKVKN